jgi:hypothetical protein
MGAKQSKEQLQRQVSEQQQQQQEQQIEEHYSFSLLDDDEDKHQESTLPLLLCDDLVIFFSSFLPLYDLICLAQVNSHLHKLITQQPYVWSQRGTVLFKNQLPPLHLFTYATLREIKLDNIRMTTGLFMKLCIVLKNSLVTLSLSSLIFEHSYRFDTIYQEFVNTTFALQEFEWYDAARIRSISPNSIHVDKVILSLIRNSEQLHSLKMNHDFDCNALLEHSNITKFNKLQLIDLQDTFIPKSLFTTLFTQLKHVDIIGLKSSLASSISTLLNSSTKDTLLSLSVGDMKDLVIETDTKFDKLENIHFNGSSLQLMVSIIQKCNNLQHIQFSNCKESTGKNCFKQCISSLNRLKSIISSSSLDNDSLLSVVINCASTLQLLHFTASIQWSCQHFENLLSVLNTSQVLQELKLSGITFDGTTWFYSIKQHLPKLKRLFISMVTYRGVFNSWQDYIPTKWSLTELFTSTSPRETCALSFSHVFQCCPDLLTLKTSSDGMSWEQFASLGINCTRLVNLISYSHTIASPSTIPQNLKFTVFRNLATARVNLSPNHTLEQIIIMIVCLQEANQFKLMVHGQLENYNSGIGGDQLSQFIQYLNPIILSVIETYFEEKALLKQQYAQMFSNEQQFHQFAPQSMKHLLQFFILLEQAKNI